MSFRPRVQSRKRNPKAWDRRPLSLGGKGNITEVFDSFRIIAQTLRFCCPNSISERNNLNYSFLFWDRFWATKPKTSGNEPKGIGNDDLCYISQIFLPKTMVNDTMPCSYIYVIAP